MPAGPHSAAGFIVSAIFRPSVSTLRTRTLTSWSTSSSSAGSSTKPSVICEMCTSPRAGTPPPGGRTSTKAPKFSRRLTVPSSHSVSGTSAKALRSARAGAPPASDLIDRAILLAAGSTLSTRTCTSSPTETSSATLFTKPSLSCVMWTRPCAAASPPLGGFRDTKAPNSRTLTTVPGSHSELSRPVKSERLLLKILLFAIERVSLSPSTALTQTVTPSPTFTTSATFSV
mmetsp:Transcript_104004/g.320826  ORF Transcript_104004/g.320826 Transcript_104004/m.320826 type:complete len:230 (+) Transcript_104004:68-757(+)